MIRLLIVDDQEIVRQGLEILLGHEPDIEVVGVGGDGDAAIEKVRELSPDVVLMDLRMPRKNGIHATRHITRHYPNVKVVVLTTYDDDVWVFDAIKAGAVSYILKDSDRSDVLTAIRGVMHGNSSLDPRIARKVLDEFGRLQSSNPFGCLMSSNHRDVPVLQELTDRELEVLQLLAQGASNQEIAAQLYLAVGTVKNYVSAIISKLHANDRTQAVIFALKRGIVDLT